MYTGGSHECCSTVAGKRFVAAIHVAHIQDSGENQTTELILTRPLVAQDSVYFLQHQVWNLTGSYSQANMGMRGHSSLEAGFMGLRNLI